MYLHISTSKHILFTGTFRMALFALRDIEFGEELTYDYNFSLFNPAVGQVIWWPSLLVVRPLGSLPEPKLAKLAK